MCGICGKLNFDGRPVDESLIRKMLNKYFERTRDGKLLLRKAMEQY